MFSEKSDIPLFIKNCLLFFLYNQRSSFFNRNKRIALVTTYVFLSINRVNFYVYGKVFITFLLN
ncbi:MAG: hypothetical protein KatS3mg091_414 [Patescibacteria group bacterium]|nr:MAG: hypothetical protein KatS3mg091_414 [Patescibacteria group bacterium]